MMRWIFSFIFIFTLVFGGWMIYSQTNLKTLSFGDQSEADVQSAEYFALTLNKDGSKGLEVKHWFEPSANTTVMQLEFQAGHHYQMNTTYPAWQFANALQQRFDQASISVAYAGIELKNIELTARTLSITLSMLTGREGDAAQLLNKVLLQGPAQVAETYGHLAPLFSLDNLAQVDAQTWFNAHINRDTATLAVISANDSKTLLNNLQQLNNLPEQITPIMAMQNVPNGQLNVAAQNHKLVIFSPQNLPLLTQKQLHQQFNSAHSGGLVAELKQTFSVNNFSVHVEADQIVFEFGYDATKMNDINKIVTQIYRYIASLKTYSNNLMEAQQAHSSKLVSELEKLSYLQQFSHLPVQADVNLNALLSDLKPANSVLLIASSTVKPSKAVLPAAFSTAQLVSWEQHTNNALMPAIDKMLTPKVIEKNTIESKKSRLITRHPERLVVNDQWQTWFKSYEFDQMLTLNLQLSSNDQAGLITTVNELNQAFAQMYNSLFKQSGSALAYLDGDQLTIELLAHTSVMDALSAAVIETVLKNESGESLLVFTQGQSFIFGDISVEQAMSLNQIWMALLAPVSELNAGEGVVNSKALLAPKNSVRVLKNKKVNRLSWALDTALIEQQSDALLVALKPYLELGLEDYFFVQRENAESVSVNIETGLALSIQSHSVNPGLLELHLEKALGQIKETLLQMSADEFSQVNFQRAQYQQQTLQSPLLIAQDYWANVKAGQHNFNQRTLKAIALERISKDQLVKFIDQNLLSDKAVKTATHQVKSGEGYNVKEFLEGRLLLK
jgi:hypothetical protein